MATKKTHKALFIPCDGDQPVEWIDLAPGLDAIYERVAPESRMFERVAGNTFDLYGDEEGLFHPDAANRINARAMQILADDFGQKDASQFRSPLVGDFMVVGLPNGRGSSTDAPESVKDFKFTWTAKKATI